MLRHKGPELWRQQIPAQYASPQYAKKFIPLQEYQRNKSFSCCQTMPIFTCRPRVMRRPGPESMMEPRLLARFRNRPLGAGLALALSTS
jgi:hypothetical protein